MVIQQQTQFKVLLIGDSCIDEYYYGTVDRLNPEAPVPILNFKNKETKPGMAANVNANLKAFGINVEFKTNSQRIVKTRYIDQRSGQHLLRMDIEESVKPFTDKITHLQEFDAVVFSDYNKGFVSEELIVSLRKHYKGPIFIDTKKKDLAKFEGCFVKINSLENSLATSFPTDLIVTEGKHGARYKNNSYSAPTVEVFDVCGAGDTFLAALVSEFLNTRNIEQSIIFANHAAGKTVQHSGVYALTTRDITEIYASINNGSQRIHRTESNQIHP
jgi:D-beta-D-heptose 7-phosphate kinase/D-beta-D-heptose 1-phosphate adenosyltransferase